MFSLLTGAIGGPVGAARMPYKPESDQKPTPSTWHKKFDESSDILEWPKNQTGLLWWSSG